MKAIKWLDKYFEEVILAVLLFAMMMIMGVQVTARYVLGNSLSWSEEITRFFFIWTGFISISYCVKHNAAIRIEQFVNLFKGMAGGKAYTIIQLITSAVELVFFAYLIPFAYHYVHSAYISQATSPALGLPMWIVQSCTLGSFVLCIIRYIQKLFFLVKDLFAKKEGEE